MYAMICWIVKDCKATGYSDLNFEEFFQMVLCFFSQRQTEMGLKYIFELFDQTKKGHLTFLEF